MSFAQGIPETEHALPYWAQFQSSGGTGSSRLAVS